MKKLFTLLFLTVFALGVKAQLADPFTFEEGLADTAWIVFGNGAESSNDDISVVHNPYISDLNGSDSVLQFIVHDDAVPWVGMYTDRIEVLEFTEEAHTMTMMVLKTVISPLRMKFELSLTGFDNVEVEVSNTLTDEWELITFVVPEAIDGYFQRLTIFPDFPATREGGSTVYLDNIANVEVNTTSVKQFSGASLKVFPNPVENRMSVQYPEMTGLTVTDLLGKTLKSYKFQRANSKVIELGELQTGLYFVTVETGNGNYNAPFIKK
ncbi:MAG: T9SS type A sorting domain-containing protein [Bacteroidales bacterium]|nr:T9SS type A sorting domain-containing protein [Bacteroidales bacterium]